MAWAVNTSGDIVGQSPNASGTPHAFLWKGGVMQDLNDEVDPASGWVLAVAYGINDNGVIVGDGYLNGAARGFRLTISDETVDTTAPTVSWVKASPDVLWPPSNQMVAVTLTVSATDDSGASPTCALAHLSSSDPHPGDMLITGPMTAQLRASKSSGGERLYTLTVQCTDAAGNTTSSSAFVKVPKSASGK
jgi:probable HAF family extracellular repeat protein